MAENDTLRAFTSSYKALSNRLINESVIKYNSDSYTNARTLWDTGATISCISHSVVNKLSLIPTGKRIISTPSDEKEVNTYLIDIDLPNCVSIDSVEVCETEIGRQGIDLLIGMDVINLGDFSVSNFNHKTVFSFSIPSMRTIDYAKRVSTYNVINRGRKTGKRKRK